MASAGAILYTSPHKHILQQANKNVPVEGKRKDPLKQEERNIVILRRKRKASPKGENHYDSSEELNNSEKFDISKLRNNNVIDISSQKYGVIRNLQSVVKLTVKSEESSDEDFKKTHKPRPIVPNYVTNADKGPNRKPRQYKRDDLDVSSQNMRITKPQSLSIAKRNARERNRVKQVNQGFATLRSRIPDYISDVYSEEKGRKNTKKLSKVETLRMAVDYIRHLETLLDFKSEDTSDAQWTTGSNQWVPQIKSENLSWSNSNSSTGYPSPVDMDYQQSSPNATYDQAFVYPERPFCDYDLELQPVKDTLIKEEGELSPIKFSTDSMYTVVGEEKIFSEVNENVYEEYTTTPLKEEEEGELAEEDVSRSDSEVEIDLSRKNYKEPDRIDENHSPLPSINESFPTKNILAFYDAHNFGALASTN